MKLNSAASADTAAALARKRSRMRVLKKNLVSYSFLLPVIIGILVFTLYPICMSFLYALSNFNGTKITQMGLFNFQKIFTFGVTGWGTGCSVLWASLSSTSYAISRYRSFCPTF